MKDFVSSRRLSVFALVASLSVVWVAGSLLGSCPMPAANLSACKNGWTSCDRSRLTLAQMTEVTLARAGAERLRIAGTGLNPCDQWKLTETEAIALAVAVYDRNVSNCKAGFTPCDHSRLTPIGGQ